MAGLLSEALLREKLGKLNTTQQVIETTSTWCCFFPKEARRIALVWEDVFSKSDQPKRLALVYLASDVVQNSRKKGPEFVTEFFKVLPRALRHMLSKADEKTATSVNKVIRIWEERRVFGSGTTSFKQLMDEAETPSRKHLLQLPSPPVVSPRAGGGSEGINGAAAAPLSSPRAALSPGNKLPSLEPLVQALQQVHQAALRCTQLGQACKAAGDPASSNSADAVAAGRTSVQQYVEALQAERDARQQAATVLQGLLRKQEDAVARLASQLESATRQLEALEAQQRQLAFAAPAGRAAAPPAAADTAVLQMPAPAAAPPAQLLDLLQFLPAQQAQHQHPQQQLLGIQQQGSGPLQQQLQPHAAPPLPAQPAQGFSANGAAGLAPQQAAGAEPEEQLEMDLSEDYSPGAAHAPPLQRHPSLQQQAQQPLLAPPAHGLEAALAMAPPAFDNAGQQQPQVLALSQALAGAAAGQAAMVARPESAAAPPPSAPEPAAPAHAAAALGAALGNGAGAASDAAALAAQLTSNQQSAQALLEALLALPKDQLMGQGRGGLESTTGPATMALTHVLVHTHNTNVYLPILTATVAYWLPAPARRAPASAMDSAVEAAATVAAATDGDLIIETFWVQVLISITLIFFTIGMLVHNHNNISIYLPILTATVAYWLPAPARREPVSAMDSAIAAAVAAASGHSLPAQQAQHLQQELLDSQQQGSRPLQQGSRPLQQGLGPLQQGLRPLQPGLGPLQQGLGPLHQGLRPLQPGLGPLQQGLQPWQQQRQPHGAAALPMPDQPVPGSTASGAAGLAPQQAAGTEPEEQAEMNPSEDDSPGATHAPPTQRHPSLQQPALSQALAGAAAGQAAPVAPLEVITEPPSSVPGPAGPAPAAAALGATLGDGAGAASDAAALAAQLTISQQREQALLEAVLALSRGGLGSGSSAGPAPAPAAGPQVMQQHGQQQQQPHVGAVQEAEYDPEDPFGE
ncbi:hypothetical protein N2152v2_005443 [Parachlorella kessleri]